MSIDLAEWSIILLCFSMACAIGGGLYEHIVLTRMWSASPPASFAIIQPGTRVPLQGFWMPVHAAITIYHSIAFADLGGCRGSPPYIDGAVSESRPPDFLDLVQRASRHSLVPVLSVSAGFT